MEVKEIIKEILESNNISQSEFAKVINFNQTTVSQWILGNKKPSFDSILAIYKKFDITPNELFGIEPLNIKK